MCLFSRDQDEKKLNVHEMATLWYEHHYGMSALRNNDYRTSIKQFSYIAKHYDIMFEDSTDFHYCAMRRTTLMYFL